MVLQSVRPPVFIESHGWAGTAVSWACPARHD